MPGPLRLLLVVTAVAASATTLALQAQGSAATLDYNRDIRPILSNTCFKCHGPDVANNQSGLRLDLRDSAIRPHTSKTGITTTAIVPGKPNASELIRRITATDASLVMPPPDALHQLTPRDRDVLRQWIAQGADYQPHWSYTPIRKTRPPEAPGAAVPVTHPIDRFIMSALSAQGLSPSPEAPRSTLVRRITLDLTGLPPTPAETDAFLNDRRPDAYERLVDRLLASPHYGERMAVPWLDLVRFADSVGFHGDQEQNIFPYRDYVIDAFNRNLPFDRFTIEQIAGDLLPQAAARQQVASGFNRLNMMTREGGAQPKEYIAKYAADRVRTVSSVWLGSTMACSECHDHKYDPFSTRDFYSLAAYFDDVKQWGVYSNYTYTPEPELLGYDNDHPFPPEIEVRSPYLQRRAARLRARMDARTASLAGALLADADSQAAVETWVRQASPALAKEEDKGWLPAPVASATAESVDTLLLPDGSVRFTDRPSESKSKAANARKSPRLSLELAARPGPTSTFRVEVLTDQEAHDGNVTRGQKYRFDLRVEFAVQRKGATTATPVTVVHAFPEVSTESYFNAKRLPSVHQRWRSDRRLTRQDQAAVYHLAQPVMLAEGDRWVVTLISNEVGRVRFSTSPLGGTLPADHLDAATRDAFLAVTPTESQRLLLAKAYVRSVGTPGGGLDGTLAGLLLDLSDCREGWTQTMVTVASEPRVTRILARGNWLDETGEIVVPATPHFLPGAKPADPAGPRSTRLDLAEWIVSHNNPLTARTFVNRLWKQFFGTGLSAVVDDLGLQGEYPSHPELLDWLAKDFMENGWDVKTAVRQIVTSATYKQASLRRTDLGEIDPANRLLAAQNPRRLDAEFIRDNALFAAGLLNLDVGGPSARPYQPEGYYEPINFPQRDYIADTDDEQYRRGVYMHWQRTFLHPMLANFDAPSREECAAARNLSTTPQQALTLMNDPTFVEAARVLAENLLAVASPSRLDTAFLRVLARRPTERERASLVAFYDEQLAAFRAKPEDARALTNVGLRRPPENIDRVELAAWTAVSRVLLNLNETIVRY